MQMLINVKYNNNNNNKKTKRQFTGWPTKVNHY